MSFVAIRQRIFSVLMKVVNLYAVCLCSVYALVCLVLALCYSVAIKHVYISNLHTVRDMDFYTNDNETRL